MDPAPTSPRPRSRAFSFRSDKSAGSKGKPDLTESPREKERRDSIWRNTSKANPNAALTEEQPGVANVVEKSTLQSLRDYQHKDVNGNAIVDPDLSNPTRPRLERPLDTIRSFEKAIDEGYKRRSSYVKGQSNDQNNQYASKRSSYFNGEYGLGHKRPRAFANALSTEYSPSSNRYSQVGGGYYGGQRPDSYMSVHTGGPPRIRYGNRTQPDPGMYGQRPYPQHSYHQSQDTMNTGVTNGSDSTGPWANSTDPSSENSSIDKVHALNKPENHGPNGYGANGFGGASNQFQGPIFEEQGQGSYGGAYPQQNGYGKPAGPPPVPTHNGPRRPIPLGGNGGLPPASRPSDLLPNKRAEPEKKKSWLARRFSKKEKE